MDRNHNNFRNIDCDFRELPYYMGVTASASIPMNNRTFSPNSSPSATAISTPSALTSEFPQSKIAVAAGASESLWKRCKRSVRVLWIRRQSRLIRKSIQSYSFEKHVLTRGFHPIADASTVRRSLGLTERNKLPFHADETRPWLPSRMSPKRQKDPDKFFLPLARELAARQQAKPAQIANRDDSPIILIT